MNKKQTAFPAVIFAFMFSFTAISEAQNMDKNQALSPKQRSIVPIAAFTATGDLQNLKPALNEGLDAGLTTNEIQDPQKIIIVRNGSQPSRNGPAEWFTGSVRIDTPFQAHDPAHFSGASVSFEPGARTAWHAHPMGQLLIVTSGTGRVQRWGDQADGIREGDVVWIPPHQKHWHGAAPDAAMPHIAILEPLDGKSTEWMQKVNDEQ